GRDGDGFGLARELARDGAGVEADFADDLAAEDALEAVLGRDIERDAAVLAVAREDALVDERELGVVVVELREAALLAHGARLVVEEVVDDREAGAAPEGYAGPEEVERVGGEADDRRHGQQGRRLDDARDQGDDVG